MERRGAGGRKRRGRAYRSEGKKRNAAAETRSRNKRVARAECGIERERMRGEGRRARREKEVYYERGRRKEREKREKEKEKERRGARKEGSKRDDGDRKCERQRGDAGDRVQLPTYGGEGRLVCSGLFHPREPATPSPQPLFFQRFFRYPRLPLAVSPVSFAPTYESIPSPPFLLHSVFLSLSPQGKTNSPWRVGARALSFSSLSPTPRVRPSPYQQSSSLVRRFECN